jgi:peptide/nickel transport system substrate-binding protein
MKPSRTRLAVLCALSLLCAAIVAGCGTDKGASSGSAKRSTSDTVIIGRASEVTSLDPQRITTGQDLITQSALFDALVKPSADYQGIQRRLATAIKTDKAGRTYTFTIPSGLKFSDGSPLTSADVRFSIKWAQKGSLYGAMLSSISSVSARDPQTVVVKLSQPDSMMLPGLSHAFVVPKDFGGQKATKFFEKPVSSGPFQLESWDPGQQMRLVRNDNFREPARLHAVVYRVISDSNARINAFQAGEIQIDEYVPEEQVDQLDKSGLVEVNPSSRLILMVTNNAKPPFDDAKVREAASLALDRKALLESVWRSHGEPVRGLLPPGVANAVGVTGGEATWGHDAARAKQLLASSSHPGASFTLVTSYDRGVNSTLAEAMQSQLGEAGFKVKLEVVDFATLIDRLLGKQFTAGMLTNGAYLPTSGEGLVTYAGLYPPVAGWNAKEAAKFVTDFRNAADTQQRDAVATQFEDWIHQGYLAIPVGAPFVYLARDPSVKGLDVTPAATYALDGVGVEG